MLFGHVINDASVSDSDKKNLSRRERDASVGGHSRTHHDSFGPNAQVIDNEGITLLRINSYSALFFVGYFRYTVLVSVSSMKHVVQQIVGVSCMENVVAPTFTRTASAGDA